MSSESTDRGTMPGQPNIELSFDAKVDLDDAEFRRTMERVMRADWSDIKVSAFNSSI